MKELILKYKSYLLYFFMYVPLGAVCPLIGQYLSSIGFNGTQVGVVTACGTGAAVLGGMVWGKIYSNSSHKRMVIIVMFLLAGAASLVSLLISAFVIYALIYGIVYFNQGPVHGLCDSMIIDKGENFPAIRAVGALGYAVSVFVAGAIAEASGLWIIFVIHALAYVVSSLIMRQFSEPTHYVRAKERPEEKVKIAELIRDDDFVKLLVFAFFALGPTMANNTYFSYLYIGAGGDLSGVGTAFLLMAGSEAVFMWLVPWLNRRIPTEKLISVAIAVGLLRFLLYSFGPSTGVLLGTFFLQGILNGILLVEIVKYFEKIVESRLASLSVATYYALGNSLPAIICNLIGGVIMDHAGIRGTYLFFAVLYVISLALYFVLGLHKERRL
ncbi:MAG: MFS transporter [Firmicutes bacterium]|nr:MFS transporter [Bacillota bacterium]